MATGVVARFDIRRGYGFVIPDDGGEDVFVHQNNIDMEGFRYLQAGEKVSYELEVGEKGMKAVQVALLEPRPPGQSPFNGGEEREERRGGGGGREDRRGGGRYDDRRGGGYEDRGSRYEDRRGGGREDRRGGNRRRDNDDGRLQQDFDRLRRKHERLVNLLVEKGLFAPGEIDGIEGGTPVPAEEGAIEDASLATEV